jgi:hypothetical protein
MAQSRSFHVRFGEISVVVAHPAQVHANHFHVKNVEMVHRTLKAKSRPSQSDSFYTSAIAADFAPDRWTAY